MLLCHRPKIFSGILYPCGAKTLTSKATYLSSVFFMKTLAHFMLMNTCSLMGTTSEESRLWRLELPPGVKICSSIVSLTLASSLGSLVSPRSMPHQRSPM